jgi:hypothetical protein
MVTIQRTHPRHWQRCCEESNISEVQYSRVHRVMQEGIGFSLGTVSFLGEFERGGVDAVAEACWCGAVVEDVAEVGFAIAALDLGPPHEEAVVGLGFDVVLVYGCGEAWPPCSRIKLSLGTEQVVAATNAQVDAGVMVVPVRARVGSLGPLLPSNMKLFRG